MKRKESGTMIYISLSLLLAVSITACGIYIPDAPSANEGVSAAAQADAEDTAEMPVTQYDANEITETDITTNNAEETNDTGISQEESATETAIPEDSSDHDDTDTGRVLLGDEQFDAYLPLLEGKRVALFTNHTGIVGDRTSAAGPADPDTPFGIDSDGSELVYGEHILDALLERGVNVTVIFSPEHGFRGTEDAGASVDNSVDEKTGIPIISLYGDNGSQSAARKNTDRFDILVTDMQDVGLRYYTYYLTLYSLMDVCSAADREVMILDRPNPNGFYVDGPILQDEYRSNVGQLPIPVVYGMTWGELARMINGEGWLASGRDSCDLTVIPCLNYSHSTMYSLIHRPSPNLRDMRAVYLYASTCFFENTAMSVGRGTEYPFEVFGSPALKGMDGFDHAFTPRSITGAMQPSFQDETCYGMDLRTISIDEICDKGIDPEYLILAWCAWQETDSDSSFWGKPDKNGIYWIDRLSGSDALRIMVEEGKTAEEIKASWQDDIAAFRNLRKPYLLYSEE